MKSSKKIEENHHVNNDLAKKLNVEGAFIKLFYYFRAFA